MVDCQCAVKVKSIMLDSANKSISELKEEVKHLNQESEDCREAAEAAEVNAAQMKHESDIELDGLRYIELYAPEFDAYKSLVSFF